MNRGRQKAKAYPLEWLKANPGILKDQVGDVFIHIQVNLEGDVVAVKDQKRNSILSTFAYRTAWQAFHPDTKVFKNE